MASRESAGGEIRSILERIKSSSISELEQNRNLFIESLVRLAQSKDETDISRIKSSQSKTRKQKSELMSILDDQRAISSHAEELMLQAQSLMRQLNIK